MHESPLKRRRSLPLTPDEEAAMNALRSLIANCFDEGE
jgi:hypothetical protein